MRNAYVKVLVQQKMMCLPFFVILQCYNGDRRRLRFLMWRIEHPVVWISKHYSLAWMIDLILWFNYIL